MHSFTWEARDQGKAGCRTGGTTGTEVLALPHCPCSWKPFRMTFCAPWSSEEKVHWGNTPVQHLPLALLLSLYPDRDDSMLANGMIPGSLDLGLHLLEEFSGLKPPVSKPSRAAGSRLIGPLIVLLPQLQPLPWEPRLLLCPTCCLLPACACSNKNRLGIIL